MMMITTFLSLCRRRAHLSFRFYPRLNRDSDFCFNGVMKNVTQHKGISHPTSNAGWARFLPAPEIDSKKIADNLLA